MVFKGWQVFVNIFITLVYQFKDSMLAFFFLNQIIHVIFGHLCYFIKKMGAKLQGLLKETLSVCFTNLNF